METTKPFIPAHLTEAHFDNRVGERLPAQDRVPGGLGEVAARAAFKAAAQNPNQQKPFNE